MGAVNILAALWLLLVLIVAQSQAARESKLKIVYYQFKNYNFLFYFS